MRRVLFLPPFLFRRILLWSRRYILVVVRSLAVFQQRVRPIDMLRRHGRRCERIPRRAAKGHRPFRPHLAGRARRPEWRSSPAIEPTERLFIASEQQHRLATVPPRHWPITEGLLQFAEHFTAPLRLSRQP